MRVRCEIIDIARYIIICIISSLLLESSEVKPKCLSCIYDNEEFLTINSRQNTPEKKSVSFLGSTAKWKWTYIVIRSLGKCESVFMSVGIKQILSKITEKHDC